VLKVLKVLKDGLMDRTPVTIEIHFDPHSWTNIGSHTQYHNKQLWKDIDCFTMIHILVEWYLINFCVKIKCITKLGPPYNNKWHGPYIGTNRSNNAVGISVLNFLFRSQLCIRSVWKRIDNVGLILLNYISYLQYLHNSKNICCLFDIRCIFTKIKMCANA
jgi:hypothetical protein